MSPHHLLYISHFLSTWNSRIFEFGAILFIASIFPQTLLPPSVYALVRAAAAICFSPLVGGWIDRVKRLRIIRVSIGVELQILGAVTVLIGRSPTVGQRVAVVVSCLGLLLLKNGMNGGWKLVVLGMLGVMACIEKLCSTMNMIAVERDWVVVIADGNEDVLRTMNSQMRRIDLVCKLLGPLAISLVDEWSTVVTIWTVLSSNVLFVGIELLAMLRVYALIPELQTRSQSLISPASPPYTATDQPLTSSTLRSAQAYLSHPAFLPSFCLTLLYFTVLSFSGQMTTYLLSVGYTSAVLGLIRALSTAVEISATWLAPLMMSRIGPTRSGLWFITWQTFWVVFATGALWHLGTSASYGLTFGVIASRVGLWGFDLSAQVIVQEGVEQENRGAFSSVEASFQNLFEMCGYATTVVFSKPEDFRYPVVMSAVTTALAGAVYAWFVRERRGHLLHVPSCVAINSGLEKLYIPWWPREYAPLLNELG